MAKELSISSCPARTDAPACCKQRYPFGSVGPNGYRAAMLVHGYEGKKARNGRLPGFGIPLLDEHLYPYLQAGDAYPHYVAQRTAERQQHPLGEDS